MKQEVTILLCNHFDLTWRRCFERTLVFEGKQWISYGEIEKFYIKRCLMLCEQDKSFCFNIESPAVLRRFLEVCPEEEKRIAAYLKKGRIDVPFTGDNIVDGNLIQGESLVRNYLYGSRYMKERFGHTSKCAYRRDAFGNSAQLPQILKQFGINWVWGLSYTKPQEPVWQGLDGTRICCMEPPYFADGGSIDKYAPCPVCGGTGEEEGNLCAFCEGMGINWKDAKFRLELPELPEQQPEYSIWGQRSEELIPPEEMLTWPEEMQKRTGGNTEFRFGTFSDLYDHLESKILQVTKEAASCGPEMNPNNTGVYVTRNKLKKICRESESRMGELEHLLAAAMEKGMKYPYHRIEKIWHNMLFLMFHDAVTGTIVDAAYEELLDIAGDISRRIERQFGRAAGFLSKKSRQHYTIYNPGLVPTEGFLEVSLPAAAGGCEFVTENGDRLVRTPWQKRDGRAVTSLLYPRMQPMEKLVVCCIPDDKEEIGPDNEDPYVIENVGYRIQLDDFGIIKIADKRTGFALEEKDGIRVHEIWLEDDEGSPWTTLGKAGGRNALTGRARRVSTEKTSVYEQAVFKISPFNTNTVEGVELTWKVTLVKNSGRIDFQMDVEYWDTYNQRIRIAFPTALKGKHLYQIPYGMLAREPYRSIGGQWDAARGDWPAVNWAGISTEKGSIALLNRGIPSYSMEEGKEGDTLTVSLLRSPCIPTYLHEPRSYDMRGFDGMRDSGSHQFVYSLICYEDTLEDSTVVEDGEAFQIKMRMLPGIMESKGAPEIESSHIRISAYYPDQDECVYIRLAEYRGLTGKAHVRVPGATRISQCFLNGEEKGNQITGEEIDVSMVPFEISTLKCEVSKCATVSR